MKQTLTRFAMHVLALPRWVKRIVALFVDINLCILTVWLAFYLRLDHFVPFFESKAWWAAGVSVLIALPVFIVSGLYRAIFRYNGWPAMSAVARAVSIYSVFYTSIITALGVPGIPRTIGIIQPILLLIFVGASRWVARLWLGDLFLSIVNKKKRSNLLIYGAGRTGRQLAAAISNSHEMVVVGFLDDDDRLQGHVLNGLRIYNPDELPHLITALQINQVVLAMPSIDRTRRNQILEAISQAHVSIRTLPRVTDLANGTVSLSDLKDLDIDDLLGREPVAANHILLSKNIVGKIVMVTGAGGSIGSELCRQILALRPSKLLLIDHSEFALYSIHQELEATGVDSESTLVPLLASVQDQDRIREIMLTWNPQTVYHAAAYKHVPLVEHNPSEGIKNNVFGTLRTAQAAFMHGVTDFVLISTDKAVRPTNIMGASKRLAEMVLQALAATQMRTKFSMVRFGNVLGSSGSVIPKFRQQIRDGGPITLTHPEVTRYFMTIPEAAQLVIQAGAMAKGGDVFVLDMGQPIKIMGLAERMVRLSGLTVKNEAHPSGDIAIEITGLRPGEKLFEELLIGENPQPSSHPKIIKAQEDFMVWARLETKLHRLDAALAINDINVIRQILKELVRDYDPSNEIVDWVYMEQATETRA